MRQLRSVLLEMAHRTATETDSNSVVRRTLNPNRKIPPTQNPLEATTAEMHEIIQTLQQAMKKILFSNQTIIR
jgi:hypothetical protein